MNLFVYGTLQDQNLLEWVLDRPLKNPYEDSVLSGYLKLSYGYFFVVCNPLYSVEGKVVRNLTVADIHRIDIFENVKENLYSRRSARVKINKTQEWIDSEVYVGEDIYKSYKGEN